jgi:hypothetical protein
VNLQALDGFRWLEMLREVGRGIRITIKRKRRRKSKRED